MLPAQAITVEPAFSAKCGTWLAAVNHDQDARRWIELTWPRGSSCVVACQGLVFCDINQGRPVG